MNDYTFTVQIFNGDGTHSITPSIRWEIKVQACNREIAKQMAIKFGLSIGKGLCERCTVAVY